MKTRWHFLAFIFVTLTPDVMLRASMDIPSTASIQLASNEESDPGYTEEEYNPGSEANPDSAKKIEPKSNPSETNPPSAEGEKPTGPDETPLPPPPEEPESNAAPEVKAAEPSAEPALPERPTGEARPKPVAAVTISTLTPPEIFAKRDP